MTHWTILEILTVILLIAYRHNRNAVWGGLTIGVIVGFIVAIFSSFELTNIIKVGVAGTLIGFVAELLGMLSDYLRKK